MIFKLPYVRIVSNSFIARSWIFSLFLHWEHVYIRSKACFMFHLSMLSVGVSISSRSLWIMSNKFQLFLLHLTPSQHSSICEFFSRYDVRWYMLLMDEKLKSMNNNNDDNTPSWVNDTDNSLKALSEFYFILWLGCSINLFT